MHRKKTKTIFPGNQMSRVRFSRLQGGRGVYAYRNPVDPIAAGTGVAVRNKIKQNLCVYSYISTIKMHIYYYYYCCCF